MSKRTCAFQKCGRPVRTLDLCAAHYLQKFKGRELTPIRPRRNPTARDDQGRKLCTKCAEWLPVDQFYVHAKTKDGLYGNCVRCHKDGALARTYGITVETFDRMHQEQGGVCAVCGGINPDGRALFVDHDHTTGAVRGLLCIRCNRGLGVFLDDVQLMEQAIAYLIKHGEGTARERGGVRTTGGSAGGVPES